MDAELDLSRTDIAERQRRAIEHHIEVFDELDGAVDDLNNDPDLDLPADFLRDVDALVRLVRYGLRDELQKVACP